MTEFRIATPPGRKDRALLVSLLIVSACGGSGADSTTVSVTTTVPGSATTRTTAPALEPWVWGVEEVDLGDGYVLGPCTGDANQFACFSEDGSVIGSAEHLTLPAETFDHLDDVDDPVESIELIATDYVSTFTLDRQSTCPNLEFAAPAPASATIGGHPGLRYGFEEADGDRVVEKNVIYGVRKDDTIGLFTFSAIADGACLSNEGELTDPAVLDFLLPRLHQAMAVVESG
jgi:hypothetical protein